MTVGITELPPEGMQLPGVALAGDAERGTKTTEGISLLFTTAGVTVQGPQPQIERLLVWSALDSATCREKLQLPDGREAAIMELTSGGQSIRFLLPSDSVSPGQAAYLDQALPTWLVRYKGTAAAVAPVPVAPGVEAEVSVALPAPGPNQIAAEAAVQPAAETPAPAYAAAGATGAVLGATGTPMAPPSTMQAPPAQAPPAPPSPAAPVMQAPPPSAPSMSAPTMSAPPPPPPPPAPAPAPPVTPVMQGPPTASAPAAPAATAWDDPPLGLATPEEATPEAKKSKKPKFALTRKQLHAAEAAAAGTAVAGTAAEATPSAPQEAVSAPTFEATKAKKPKFALTRKQLRAAEAAATGTAVAGTGAVESAPAAPEAAATAPAVPAATEASAPEATKAKKPKFALTRKQLRAAEAAATGSAVVGAVAATTDAPPTAPPSDPVPLAVQPPPPVASGGPAASAVQPIPPTGDQPPGDGTGDSSGGPGADGVVLAESGSKPNRRNLVLLVVLLVLVVAVGGYLISKKSSSTTTAPAPSSAAAADTALAGSINLHLADLPTGWTQAPPAQAIVRLPVAPAAAQANAANAMASCLNTSYAVVSGLFDSGSLPGQTSLVQSPMFESASGPAFEMASRTTTMASPGQVQALDAVFTNPKFDLCYQDFRTALAQGAVPGASVQVQPVTLTAPKGVTTYGMVSTYSLPGVGTEVVGDAYLLGGRVVTVIQPSTNGPAIPSDVFAPAYDAVAGRIGASVTK